MTEKRLLIVDEGPELGELVRRMAVGLGYDVMVTSDCHGFMQAFNKFNPTAAMLDVVLPNMDGIELVRWLHDRGCNARVLVSSAAQGGYAVMAKKLGEARGLKIQSLEKPYRINALRDALTHPVQIAC